MATNLRVESQNIPSAKGMKMGIVVAEWHSEITNAMLESAVKVLLENGVTKEDIKVEYVPGSYELVSGAQLLLEYTEVSAVICLGCVVQGETRHFEFICEAVANGLINLQLKYSSPVIFGVLTTDTFEQAKERAGGRLGNKGEDAAIAAIKMVALENKLIDN